MSAGAGLASARIHVAHVLYGFVIGGLENGLVNLINRLDPERYQHAIISLSDYDPNFAKRLSGDNYSLHAMHKRDGNDLRMWVSMFRLLRELRPHIVHTRNFVALETHLPAILAGVGSRVHGEHGWDVHDLDGSNLKHRLGRRVLGFGVHRFVALSRELESYLVDKVKIPPVKVTRICNGVDDEQFLPGTSRDGSRLVLGTVGRMKTVKNQTALCRAYCALLARRPDLRTRTRLRLVGAGPLLEPCRRVVAQGGCDDLVEFPGDSSAIADELRNMDLFVLPSLAEGISNTILEAMACGLPVVATEVGGNAELVADGMTGKLVPVNDDEAMAAALELYIDDRRLRAEHGERARKLIEQRFSLRQMVSAYDQLYSALVA